MIISFKEAIPLLTRRIEHQEIADQLGVSRAAIRQALLPEDSKSFRTPPLAWRFNLEILAKARIDELKELVRLLEVGDQ